MMCPRVLALRCPTMAASVVDLPEPVAPASSTRPRLVMTMSFRIGGSSRSSTVGISVTIRRSTAPDHALLNKSTDTETTDTLRIDREVTFLCRIEITRLLVVHDRTHDHRTLFRGEALLSRAMHLTINLDGRWKTGRNEQNRNHSWQRASSAASASFWLPDHVPSLYSCIPNTSVSPTDNLEFFLVDGTEACLFPC